MLDAALVAEDGGDERWQRLTIVADVRVGGLAVVDQQRDVHRLLGRRNRQHLARHFVFADQTSAGVRSLTGAPFWSSALTYSERCTGLRQGQCRQQSDENQGERRHQL